MSENTSVWKYYNHALLPNTASDAVIEEPQWTTFWNRWSDKVVYMARWTTDFDCKEPTEWWWVIKDAPYRPEALNASSRKHIRQAEKRCRVEKIQAAAHKAELWDVYRAAYGRYRNADNFLQEDDFYASLTENVDYWAAFDAEDGRMIGWMTCKPFADSVTIQTAKYVPEAMTRRPSDAIHHAVCTYYLNERGMRFLSAGERTVNHATNSQQYKIDNFGFRKAYCRLHIVYRGWMGTAVKVLYPLRGLVRFFRRLPVFHSVDAVLGMETIRRSFAEKNG